MGCINGSLIPCQFLRGHSKITYAAREIFACVSGCHIKWHFERVIEVLIPYKRSKIRPYIATLGGDYALTGYAGIFE
jgi:hypothetical protein